MLPVILLLTQLLSLLPPPRPAFEAQTLDDNVAIGYGIALGDVDGDGKPDILLADKKQFVWYRNGDWKKFVLAENLTQHDNVCIAARDVDGDGKVEIAVGAQWNPGETGNAEQSGSVHYLVRPADPTQLWKAVTLPHEPTVHRMRWVQAANGEYYLVVLPLHGRNNKGGEGAGVNFLAFAYPEIKKASNTARLIGTNMHLTHNFDIVEGKGELPAGLYLAGKEGVRLLPNRFDQQAAVEPQKLPGLEHGTGEVRLGKAGKPFMATIEPMHGNELAVYLKDVEWKRILLDSNLKEGHALAAADLLGTGQDQIVAGWRLPNKDGKVGIKLYWPKNRSRTEWESTWIDDNGMACEDLQVMDLNGDGKKDIIASGRASHNLKIYWNKSVPSR